MNMSSSVLGRIRMLYAAAGGASRMPLALRERAARASRMAEEVVAGSRPAGCQSSAAISLVTSQIF